MHGVSRPQSPPHPPAGLDASVFSAQAASHRPGPRGPASAPERRLDLREAIDDAVGPQVQKAAAKGLVVHLDVDERVPAAAVVNAALLHEVLLRLTDHAIRTTLPPGRLEVRIALEEPNGQRDDHDGLCIKVTALSHAFPKLSVRCLRLIDSVVKLRHEDPNLTALAGLLAENGGSLATPEDEPGGVANQARIPVRRAEGRTDDTVEDAVEGPLPVGTRALIVGGGGPAARELEASLSDLSVEVAIAPSGGKALLEIRRAADANRPFDVVLVHARLSDRSGSDLAMDIRREPRLGDPLVVMIAEADERGDTLRIDRTRVPVTVRRPIERPVLLGVLVAAQGINKARQTRLRRRRSDARPRVLFIGNGTVRGRSLASLLEANGYAVTSVEDGSTGLDVATRQSFALVIVGSSLSGPEATALCRTLRERGELLQASVPVVAITGLTPAADAAMLMAAGADGLLPKGATGELLLAAVEAWCGDLG